MRSADLAEHTLDATLHLTIAACAAWFIVGWTAAATSWRY